MEQESWRGIGILIIKFFTIPITSSILHLNAVVMWYDMMLIIKVWINSQLWCSYIKLYKIKMKNQMNVLIWVMINRLQNFFTWWQLFLQPWRRGVLFLLVQCLQSPSHPVRSILPCRGNRRTPPHGNGHRTATTSHNYAAPDCQLCRPNGQGKRRMTAAVL